MVTLTFNNLKEIQNFFMQMSELGAAKYAKRFEPCKDSISQREAYRLFGEQKIKFWLRKAIISKVRQCESENSKFSFSYSECLSAATAEKMTMAISY